VSVFAKRSVARSLVGPTLKLIAAAIVSTVLAMFIMNGIKNPVSGDLGTYRALFTDVSGLHPNADVRLRGLKVGKVTEVELHPVGDTTRAQVTFTLDTKYRVVPDSRLAVKYASLSGVRYLDLAGAESGAGPAVRDVPVTQTIPSFDVTQLFNGLQPVLETLSPDELNRFSNNAVTLLQGDGSGLGDMLRSIEKLAGFATDRQRVISTIVENISKIADGLGGNAPQIIEFLGYIEKPLDSVLTVLDEFRKGDLYGPTFMGSVNTLLHGLGIDPDTDIDGILGEAFPTLANLGNAFKLLPTVTGQIVRMNSSAKTSGQCRHGTYQLPAWGTVLLGGTEVALCKAR